MEGYLLAIDFEKAFDPLNHNLLITVSERYSLGHDFINWIKIFLKNQKSCVLNGGHAIHCFNLERDTCQGNSILANLYILVAEILFIFTKSNKTIHGIKILKQEYLYAAYADDTTFRKSSLNSVKIVFSLIDSFSKFSGLYPNVSKCEIAEIGVMKNVKLALSGAKNVDLTKETIKILGAHISYNKKLQGDLNFRDSIKNIVNVIIRLWRMRKLTLEDKITIFKCLAISKILYVALLTSVPNSVIEEMKQIQEMFLLENEKPKIKHDIYVTNIKMVV